MVIMLAVKLDLGPHWRKIEKPDKSPYLFKTHAGSCKVLNKHNQIEETNLRRINRAFCTII